MRVEASRNPRIRSPKLAPFCTRGARCVCACVCVCVYVCVCEVRRSSVVVWALRHSVVCAVDVCVDDMCVREVACYVCCPIHLSVSSDRTVCRKAVLPVPVPPTCSHTHKGLSASGLLHTKSRVPKHTHTHTQTHTHTHTTHTQTDRETHTHTRMSDTTHIHP